MSNLANTPVDGGATAENSVSQGSQPALDLTLSPDSGGKLPSLGDTRSFRLARIGAPTEQASVTPAPVPVANVLTDIEPHHTPALASRISTNVSSAARYIASSPVVRYPVGIAAGAASGYFLGPAMMATSGTPGLAAIVIAPEISIPAAALGGAIIGGLAGAGWARSKG